ncbi:MAG: ABC transporter permease [Planctomycetes bacterium]|nr:ABC transporter permease [Planctomycetota bacterium]
MRRFLPFDYAVRNLGRSGFRLALSVCGSLLVVLLVLAAVAFVNGMRRSLIATGGEHNVILLGAGSEESIERSQIQSAVAGIAAASVAGVRSRLGVAYVSPEVHVAFPVKRRKDEPGKGKLAVLRGVTPAAFLVHGQVRIAEGRAPEAGRDEILIGDLVPSKLGVARGELKVGDTLWIDERSWRIAGKLAAPSTVFDGEIWIPLSDLQVMALQENLSCVVMTLEPGRGEVADVAAFAAQRLDLELAVLAERDYYRKLSEFFAPIRALVIVTAALIALGGVLGGLNIMYAAVAARVREIAMLQVLGYSRVAIVCSIVQESVLISAVGALVAAMAGAWLLDGIAVRFSMGAFGLDVDGGVIAIALGAAVLFGAAGALPPAFRCLRLEIPTALRS